MSIEDFKKFGKMCADDEAVRAKAKEIGMEDLNGIIAYGKELGLEFSIQDITKLAEQEGVLEAELSEEQLEQVAGGVFTTTVAGVGAAAMAVVGAGAGVVGAVGAGGIAAGTVATSATRGW